MGKGKSFFNFKGILGLFLCVVLMLTLFAPIISAATVNYAQITGGTVNVRSGPSTSHSILGVVKSGTKLPMVSTTQNNGFYNVTYNGKNAYVSASYSKLVTENTPTPTGKNIIVTGANVNVRAGSNTSSTILGVAKKDQKYQLLSANPVNGFYYINYNGKNAYISASYSKIENTTTPPPTPTPDPTPTPTGKNIIVTAANVNVRAGSNTSSAILGVAKINQKYQLLSNNPVNGFYYINYNGKNAYISASYSKIENTTTPPPTPPTPPPTPTPTGKNIIVTGASVNIRAASNASSAILGIAKKNEKYQLLSNNPVNGFFYILYNGKNAYISASYSVLETTNPSPTGQYLEIMCDSINVRSGPGGSYKSLGIVHDKQRLPLLSTTRTSGYFKVSYNNQTGYVSDAYTDIVKPLPIQPDYSLYKDYIRSRVNDYLTVRKEASGSAASWGTIPNAEMLPLLSTTTVNGFYKVLYNGQTGYVLSAYSQRLSPAAAANFKSSVTVLNVGEKSNYTIRADASATSKSLGFIKGQTVAFDMIGSKGAWTLIQVREYATNKLIKGYVESRLIKTAQADQTWGVVVDKRNQTVTVFKDSKVVRFMSCTTGKKSTETPAGTYLVGSRLTYFDSTNSRCFDAVLINGQIYFHRMPRMDKSLTYPYENVLGSKGSAGCIRLPYSQSQWMYDSLPRSTKVIIIDG